MRAMNSAQIKERALQLGFSKVGIVRPESLSPELNHLQEWLVRGFHGEMKWMERDPAQRADPRLFWPQARSVIVVALNYYTPHEHAVRTTHATVSTGSDSDRIKGGAGVSGATGKVSRYAWGDDYHDILAGKLR